jgi:hypothetical protein
VAMASCMTASMAASDRARASLDMDASSAQA